MDRKALAAAFPVTLPVLMGYLAIGIGVVVKRRRMQHEPV